MKNSRSVGKKLVDDPELVAMAAICKLLQELPDEASRVRVMRWSFARFHPELQRTEPGPAEPASPQTEPDESDLAEQISELRELFEGNPLPARSIFALATGEDRH